MFGLTPAQLDEIRRVLQAEMVTKAVVFGSRAKGTQKTGSDIDLAVVGDAARVADRLNEETLLPYYFDVVDLNALTNANLMEHIDRVGVDLLGSRPETPKLEPQGNL